MADIAVEFSDGEICRRALRTHHFVRSCLDSMYARLLTHVRCTTNVHVSHWQTCTESQTNVYSQFPIARVAQLLAEFLILQLRMRHHVQQT